MMRTTLTLEGDVAEAIAQLREKRGLGLKEAINQILRLGLRAMDEQSPRGATFRTKVVRLKPRVSNLDDIAEVLAQAEGDDFL